jgi:outer membrane protein assembly factor BamE
MSWFELSPKAMLSKSARVAMPAGLALVLGLAGCGSISQGARNVANTLPLYRAEVVQGNFVSREQVAQLHAGMTRLQVRDLLGTPLITPLFEGDRWDYVFTMNRPGVPRQHYRLTLYFSDDALDHFNSDEMPSENEFVQRISGHTRKAKVPPLQATPDQLKQFATDNPVPAVPTPDAAASAAAPDKTYPPLE